MKTSATLLLCGLLASSAAAQEKTPIPPFTGEPLYVAGVPDTYEPLRDDIRRLERSSHQKYYVVVVNASGPGKDATRLYTDALYKDWLEQAARKGLRLDPDRSVIVVLAVANRQLSVHAGAQLRSEYGLSPDRIDQDIVRPVFLPHAKAGNYLKGLQAVVAAIEQQVVARDGERGGRPPVGEAPALAAAGNAVPVAAAQQPLTMQTEPPPTEAPLQRSHLPLVIGLIGVVIVVFLGAARLRHVRTRRRVEARLNEFRDRVMDLRQRVEAVKERHKLLPTLSKDLQTPMAGATLQSYNQVDADVRRLMDDWLRRMDVWERVEGLIGTEAFFRARRLQEASRLLEQLGSFDEVDTACQGCVASLDRLEHAHAQGRELLRAAEEHTARLGKQRDSLAELRLATEPYARELTVCAASLENGRQLVAADPLGAIAIAEAAHKHMDALGRRMEDVVRLFQRAPEAQAALDRVARVAEERRAGGLRLTESDGDPDPLVEQGRARHGELLQALQCGEPESAASNLEQALALATEAEQRITRQAEARAHCQNEIPARRSAAERLRQTAAQAETQRLELERDFAPESWREVAWQMVRSGELQPQSVARLAEASEAASDGVQHYFRAKALLEEVEREQEQAVKLLQGVGPCLQRLTELRRACQARRQEVADLARQAEAYLAANEWVVRQPARSRLDAAKERWRQAVGLADSPRPDWPAVQQVLEEARTAYAAARKEAEEDVRCHRQLVDRLGEVERAAERVGACVGQPREVRQQAVQTYRSAIEQFDSVRQEMAARRADWAQLVRQLEAAESGLTRAEELARQDVQLAERAALEIDEAARHIGQARSFLEDGVAADVGPADGRLQQAQRHLEGQAYELAIDQAKAAQQAARQARDDAVNRVRLAQQAREAERRREVAAAALAAQAWTANPSAGPVRPEPPPQAAAERWSSADAAPGPPAEAESPPEEPPSESSQTSW